jgi:hypothetical protein
MLRSDKPAKPFAPNNCPIREHTADGVPVGRCWYHCPRGVCPRHGDVRSALAHYRTTGRLTNEVGDAIE